MVKEIYDSYKKRFKLPDYKTMDEEFELSSIETPDFFLRQVRRKIKEKIHMLLEILAEILNPSSESLVQLNECRIFGTKEKKEIYKLFRQVQYCNRALDEAELQSSEKTDAHLIEEVYQKWKEIKKETIPYLTKLKNYWKEDPDPKESLEYFG